MLVLRIIGHWTCGADNVCFVVDVVVIVGVAIVDTAVVIRVRGNIIVM